MSNNNRQSSRRQRRNSSQNNNNNNSDSHDSGTAPAEVIVMTVSNYFEPWDTFHARDRPCSQWLFQIAQNIFPHTHHTGMRAVSSQQHPYHPGAGGGNFHPHYYRGSSGSSNSSGTPRGGGGRGRRNQLQQDDATSAHSHLTFQSALGPLLQRHFLEQRSLQIARTALEETSAQPSSTAATTTATSTAASKKKRKKKKRKKGDDTASATASTTTGEDATTTAATTTDPADPSVTATEDASSSHHGGGSTQEEDDLDSKPPALETTPEVHPQSGAPPKDTDADAGQQDVLEQDQSPPPSIASTVAKKPHPSQSEQVATRSNQSDADVNQEPSMTNSITTRNGGEHTDNGRVLTQQSSSQEMVPSAILWNRFLDRMIASSTSSSTNGSTENGNADEGAGSSSQKQQQQNSTETLPATPSTDTLEAFLKSLRENGERPFIPFHQVQKAWDCIHCGACRAQIEMALEREQHIPAVMPPPMGTWRVGEQQQQHSPFLQSAFIASTPATSTNGETEKEMGGAASEHTTTTITNPTLQTSSSHRGSTSSWRYRQELRRKYLPPDLHRDEDQSIVDAYSYIAMEEGFAPSARPEVQAQSDRSESIFGGERGEGPMWAFFKVGPHQPDESFHDGESITPFDPRHGGWQLGLRDAPSAPIPWQTGDFDQWLIQSIIFNGADVDFLFGVPPDHPHSWQTTMHMNDGDGGAFLDEMRANPDFRSIRDSVESRCRHMDHVFEQISKQLEEAFVALRETDRGQNSGNIDFNSFPKMQDADDACAELIKNLLGILLDATEAVQEIVYYHAAATARPSENKGDDEISNDEWILETGWAVEPVANLFQMLLGIIQEMLQATMDFEEQFFRLADHRTGSLPSFFLSDTARGLYRDLVELKLRCVHRAVDRLRKGLDKSVEVDLLCDSTTTLIRRILTERAYCQVMISHELNRTSRKNHGTARGQLPHAHYHARLHPPELRSSLDASCCDFIEAARVWMQTVLQENPQAILSVHSQRHMKLARHIENLLEEVSGAMQDTQDSSAPAVERSNLILSDMKREMLALQESLNEGDQFARVQNFRKNFGDKIVGIIMNWIDYKGDCSSAKPKPAWPPGPHVPAMPVSLKKIMIAPVRSTPCNGGNGMTRATAIMNSLLYRWFNDRYVHWQARVAEEELLTTIAYDDFLLEEQGDIVGGEGGKSKKNKKKKTKRSSSTVQDPANKSQKGTEIKTEAAESSLSTQESPDKNHANSDDALVGNGLTEEIHGDVDTNNFGVETSMPDSDTQGGTTPTLVDEFDNWEEVGGDGNKKRDAVDSLAVDSQAVDIEATLNGTEGQELASAPMTKEEPSALNGTSSNSNGVHVMASSKDHDAQLTQQHEFDRSDECTLTLQDESTGHKEGQEGSLEEGETVQLTKNGKHVHKNGKAGDAVHLQGQNDTDMPKEEALTGNQTPPLENQTPDDEDITREEHQTSDSQNDDLYTPSGGEGHAQLYENGSQFDGAGEDTAQEHFDIGVVDRDGVFESVEELFLGRFQRLLASDENVVFLPSIGGDS